LDEGKQRVIPSRTGSVVVVAVVPDATLGEAPLGIVVGVQGQAQLLHVVLTLGPSGGGADLLDGRQQQADQDGDDGNHHQKLDESKTSTARLSHGFPSRKRVPPLAGLCFFRTRYSRTSLAAIGFLTQNRVFVLAFPQAVG